MRWFRRLAAVTLGLCLLPFLALTLSMTVASLAKCQVDEGSPHPCLVAGRDVGEWLYSGFVMGWLGVATLPVLMVLVPGWILVEFIVRYRARQAG